MLEKLTEMDVYFHAKNPLFSSDFNQNWIISTDLIEIPQCEVSRKSAWQCHERA
jgi:hypothetical protein